MSTPGLFTSLLDTEQISRSPFFNGSSNLPDKNGVKCFKDFALLQAQIISPNQKNIGFSNSIHRFFNVFFALLMFTKQKVFLPLLSRQATVHRIPTNFLLPLCHLMRDLIPNSER